MSALFIKCAMNPEYVLNIPGANVWSGAQMIVYELFWNTTPGIDTAENETWLLTADGLIVPTMAPDYALAPGPSSGDGYLITLVDYDPGDTSQLWTVADTTNAAGQAISTLQNQGNGQYLSVSVTTPSDVGNGTPVGTSNGPVAANQTWMLAPVLIGGVRVVQATWGNVNGSVDVTAAMQGAIDGGSQTLWPTTEWLGSPGSGANLFAMTYVVGDTKYSAACTDGQSVTISLTPAQVVIDAVWGDSTAAIDVGAAVQAQINAGVTTMTANDTTFGADPATSDDSKTFGMSYVTSTGQLSTVMCTENQTFTLA